MITSGAMTNRIQRLVAKGPVNRETDPANLRSVLITLTDRGRELVGQALGDHVYSETRLLDSLSPDDQEHLAGSPARSRPASCFATSPERRLSPSVRACAARN